MAEKVTKVGYTYAGYHRGRKRGNPLEFERVDKRPIKYGGVKRVRNVWRHPVTGQEYIFDNGYFINNADWEG